MAHGHKLFKKRFRLNARKYAFSNEVIDNWNLLSAKCVNCSTINTFKKHLSSEVESEAVKFTVSRLVGIIYGESLCLLMPASSVEACHCWRRCEFGEKFSRNCQWRTQDFILWRHKFN